MSEETTLEQKMTQKQSETKFSDDEIKKIQEIQKSYSEITTQLGQVGIAKIRLREQEVSLAKEEDKLNTSFVKIQNDEQKFLDEITKKYGQGTLNPETGVFTPNKSQ